mmetsp:Transcript_18535/g.52264  ORF Transcript_18535/g.52264 Transcript_18535/m.52264 type:complete len:149 (+) Transcript_18535:769-1215(+)
MLWPVVEHLRKLGIKLQIHVDDILMAATSKVIAIKHTKIVVETLQQIGFHINWEKSELVPAQGVQCLGMTISSRGGPMLKVPAKKRRNVSRDVKRLLRVELLQSWQGETILEKSPDIHMTTDASPIAWGANLKVNEKTLKAGHVWSEY